MNIFLISYYFGKIYLRAVYKTQCELELSGAAWWGKAASGRRNLVFYEAWRRLRTLLSPVSGSWSPVQLHRGFPSLPLSLSLPLSDTLTPPLPDVAPLWQYTSSRLHSQTRPPATSAPAVSDHRPCHLDDLLTSTGHMVVRGYVMREAQCLSTFKNKLSNIN